MTRFKLILEYDGTPFVGWQRQTNGLSVQEVLETAIAAVEEREVATRAAGRTDTGVHATGQAVHADFAKSWREDQLRDALNAWLRPHPVVVLSAHVVAVDFDARFSAHRRHYLYRILNRRGPPALDINRVWPVTLPLDAEAMHEAAQRLLGRHDFTTFRASACQARNATRTLDQLDVRRVGDEIHIETSARSFLHSQVRSMVGSLKRVGEGRWTADDLARAFAACDRSACGPVAPPCGLYLEHVAYGAGGAVPADVAEELATDE